MTPADPTAPPSAPPWRLQLLGGPRLQRGAIVVEQLGHGSTLLLLARLALWPQRQHPREELVELLWPGIGLDVGRNRLRQALFALRRWLDGPSPALEADRLGVRLVPGSIACDVTRFERCVREGRLAEARALYVGELLPGFYDGWVADERMRLAALAERALDAPAPMRAAATDLPVYLTRFFGREAETARLRAEVQAHRLVTLLGPGGSGKTRLAVELAAALQRGAADGASPGFDLLAFVPLVGCSSRAEALDALLAGLRLQRHDGDALATLADALAGRRALLVLDNFEQLSGVAEDVVAALAMRAPDLHLLVTSRRVLGVDGEREFWLQPLASPQVADRLDTAARNPAVALFIDRARAAHPGFLLGADNLAAVLDAVRLLDGLPLALELAAARVRSMAPAAIASLLRAARDAPAGQALALLARSGPRSGADPRHASMLRVVEWSWRLLAPPQGRLLAALTVFHGGFGAEAAQAVCGAVAEPMAVQLDELVGQSLLRVAARDGGSRYALLEPVREYAALQLAAPGAAALRARHRAWLTAWAEAWPPTPALAGLRDEMANVLAALRSALADADPDAALRLLLALRRGLEDVELPADGLDALVQATERSSDAALRAQADIALGPLLLLAGRRADALRHLERGLAATAAGAPWRGEALRAFARTRWRVARDEAELQPLLAEAEPLARAAGDASLLAGLMSLRATVHSFRGDHAGAEALNRQALTLWEALDHQHAVNLGRYNLAVCVQNAGRHAQALERLVELEPGLRRLQDWRRLSQALNVRGNALCGLRRWREAASAFREATRMAWDHLAPYELAFVLWNLPRALAHLREPERALRLGGFAEAFWLKHFGALGAGDRHDQRRLRRLARCQRTAPQVEALLAEGAALALPDAVALALR